MRVIKDISLFISLVLFSVVLFIATARRANYITDIASGKIIINRVLANEVK